MSVTDIKRYSPNTLDTLLEKSTSTTKTVTPKKKSPSEIIQDAIKSLHNQSKDTTDFKPKSVRVLYVKSARVQVKKILFIHKKTKNNINNIPKPPLLKI